MNKEELQQVAKAKLARAIEADVRNVHINKVMNRRNNARDKTILEVYVPELVSLPFLGQVCGLGANAIKKILDKERKLKK